MGLTDPAIQTLLPANPGWWHFLDENAVRLSLRTCTESVPASLPANPGPVSDRFQIFHRLVSCAMAWVFVGSPPLLVILDIYHGRRQGILADEAPAANNFGVNCLGDVALFGMLDEQSRQLLATSSCFPASRLSAL